MRLLCGLLLVVSAIAQGAEPIGGVRELLAAMDGSPHTEQIASSSLAVVDHEIGLGAIRKVHGAWEFKDSARHDGLLTRFTWQVKDGFASAELLRKLERETLALTGAQLLFECDGRGCGHANQWANRVFGQRLLYGKSDEQHYRVIAVEGGRVLLYSSARTTDRQYLHADYLAFTGM